MYLRLHTKIPFVTISIAIRFVYLTKKDFQCELQGKIDLFLQFNFDPPIKLSLFNELLYFNLPVKFFLL
jgi:hypothetical protein